MSSSSCSRRLLAIGDLALVERCTCGAIHLTIGAVTLRLAGGSIAPIADTLVEAGRALALEHALGQTLS